MEFRRRLRADDAHAFFRIRKNGSKASIGIVKPLNFLAFNEFFSHGRKAAECVCKWHINGAIGLVLCLVKTRVGSGCPLDLSKKSEGTGCDDRAHIIADGTQPDTFCNIKINDGRQMLAWSRDALRNARNLLARVGSMTDVRMILNRFTAYFTACWSTFLRGECAC